MMDDMEKNWHVDHFMKSVGFYGKYLKARKDDIQPVIWNDAFEKFMKRTSLYIHGHAGTGKTYLVSALVREYLFEKFDNFLSQDEPKRLEFDIEFANVPELFRNIRRAIQTDGNSVAIVDRLCDTKCLIIDDLGAEQNTEFVQTELYSVINHRDIREKWTVITSNLSLDQLSNKLGDRIASRIAGMCFGLELIGNDRRLIK